MKNIFTVLLTIIGLTSSFAQGGYDWGDDKITASRKYQTVKVYMDAKKYEECREPLFWLIRNTPNLNSNLYKRASVIYKGLEKKEADPAKKKVYQDSTLWSYDTWIEKFGSSTETPKIEDKKAKVYYRYYLNRPEKNLEELAVFYKRVIETNGVKVTSKNIEYYMAIVIEEKTAGKITDKEVLENYAYCLDQLSKIQSANVSDKAKSKAEKSESNISAVVVKSVKMDCDQVIEYYKPLVLAAPEDMAIRTSARIFIEQNKCTDQPYYVELLKSMVEKNPDAKLYKYIAQVEYQKKNYSQSITYFKKSIEIDNDVASKSGSMLTVAKLYSSTNNKVESRAYAKKVIATGQNVAKAHELIGDLYYSSTDDCANQDVLKARSIYIAAYNEYQKAGATKKMANAKAQFPSMEDIFSQSKKVGDQINTGCWINEDVSLEKR